MTIHWSKVIQKKLGLDESIEVDWKTVMKHMRDEINKIEIAWYHPTLDKIAVLENWQGDEALMNGWVEIGPL